MIRFPIASILSACTAGILVFATTMSAQAASLEQPADAPRLHGPDQDFIAGATTALSTQRDAARIATARSTDREVKEFAERVSNDSAKLSDELRAASPRGIDVPNNDPEVAVLDRIKNLRGGEFDRAYIEQIALTGEQRAMSTFQSEIASGRDEHLKDAARNALPIIQAQYAQAQELAKRKHFAEGSAQ